MKFLILGGTVFLSKAIATAARDRGHDVTVAARGKRGDPPTDTRFIRLDRSDEDGFAAFAGEEFDAVVEVSSLPGHVALALESLADRVGHWTYVSSISAYADHSVLGQTPHTAAVAEPISAGSVDPDVELYGRSKVTCENLVRERLGNRAFIVRPGLIVGPGDPTYRFGYWPDRIVNGGEILAPGSPKDSVQWIDVRDHAEWVVHAAETQLVGVFDAVCAPIARENFLRQLAAEFNVEPDFTWVPQGFLLEHGVAPWSGEQSIGMWLPVPETAGMMDHDVTASLRAGLNIRPLGSTARDWYEWSQEAAPQVAKRSLSRHTETSVLEAWKGSPVP